MPLVSHDKKEEETDQRLPTLVYGSILMGTECQGKKFVFYPMGSREPGCVVLDKSFYQTAVQFPYQ